MVRIKSHLGRSTEQPSSPGDSALLSEGSQTAPPLASPQTFPTVISNCRRLLVLYVHKHVCWPCENELTELENNNFPICITFFFIFYAVIRAWAVATSKRIQSEPGELQRGPLGFKEYFTARQGGVCAILSLRRRDISYVSLHKGIHGDSPQMARTGQFWPRASLIYCISDPLPAHIHSLVQGRTCDGGNRRCSVPAPRAFRK